jgi:hypothetical protein
MRVADRQTVQFFPKIGWRLETIHAQFPELLFTFREDYGRPPSLRDCTYPSRIALHPAFTLIDNLSASATIFMLAARRTKSFV